MAKRKQELETWKTIPGIENYEASNLGRVRSLTRKLIYIGRHGNAVERRHKGRIIKLKKNNRGYFYFATDGRKLHLVSRIVCLTFHGRPPSPGYEAAHRNGRRADNRPQNLRWITPKENAYDRALHGTQCRGSSIGTSVLSENDIKPIFEAYCSGIAQKKIGQRLGVSKGAIIAIIRGHSWVHVDVGDLRLRASMMKAAFRRKMRFGYSTTSKPTRIAARAHTAVGRAIKSGKLIRPCICENCGGRNQKIEAAHWDYERPLDVRWLCKPCHRNWDYLAPKGGTLTMVRWSERDDGNAFTAWPRENGGGKG